MCMSLDLVKFHPLYAHFNFNYPCNYPFMANVRKVKCICKKTCTNYREVKGHFAASIGVGPKMGHVKYQNRSHDISWEGTF